MPSALETLVKILKLERQQGYKNNAVIGGLAAYGDNWKDNAHQQARKPEHHWLVNELSDLLSQYDQIEAREDRHKAITYMMDRIMGRVPPPSQYQMQEEEQAEIIAAAPVKETASVQHDAPDDSLPETGATVQAAPVRAVPTETPARKREAVPRTRVVREKDTHERRQPERRRDEGRKPESHEEFMPLMKIQ